MKLISVKVMKWYPFSLVESLVLVVFALICAEVFWVVLPHPWREIALGGVSVVVATQYQHWKKRRS